MKNGFCFKSGIALVGFLGVYEFADCMRFVVPRAMRRAHAGLPVQRRQGALVVPAAPAGAGNANGLRLQQGHVAGLPILPALINLPALLHSNIHNSVELDAHEGILNILSGKPGVLEDSKMLLEKPRVLSSVEELEQLVFAQTSVPAELGRCQLAKIYSVHGQHALCEFREIEGVRHAYYRVNLKTYEVDAVPFSIGTNSSCELTDFVGSLAVGYLYKNKAKVSFVSQYDQACRRWFLHVVPNPYVPEELLRLDVDTDRVYVSTHLHQINLSSKFIVGDCLVREYVKGSDGKDFYQQVFGCISDGGKRPELLPKLNGVDWTSAICISGDSFVVGGFSGSKPVVWRRKVSFSKTDFFDSISDGVDEFLVNSWKIFQLPGAGVVRYLSYDGSVATGNEADRGCLWVYKNGRYYQYFVSDLLNRQGILNPCSEKMVDAVWASDDGRKILCNGYSDGRLVPYLIELHEPLCSPSSSMFELVGGL
jgi:hypothetical protein